MSRRVGAPGSHRAGAGQREGGAGGRRRTLGQRFVDWFTVEVPDDPAARGADRVRRPQATEAGLGRSAAARSVGVSTAAPERAGRAGRAGRPLLRYVSMLVALGVLGFGGGVLVHLGTQPAGPAASTHGAPANGASARTAHHRGAGAAAPKTTQTTATTTTAGGTSASPAPPNTTATTPTRSAAPKPPGKTPTAPVPTGAPNCAPMRMRPVVTTPGATTQPVAGLCYTLGNGNGRTWLVGCASGFQSTCDPVMTAVIDCLRTAGAHGATIDAHAVVDCATSVRKAAAAGAG